MAIVMPLAEQRGGGEVMLRQLIEHGCAGSVEWLVIFLRDGPMVELFERFGVEVHVVDAGRLRQPHRYAAAIAQIAGIVHRGKVEAILGWMVKSQLYGGPAALLAGVPAVWFQVGAPYRPGWLDRAATAIPARGIMAVSEVAALAQSQIRPRRPRRVVHPGVELDRFDATRLVTPTEARMRFGLPLDVPIIGLVGRIQRWKGIHVLVEAIPAVLRDYPSAHFIVVGGAHDLEPDYLGQIKKRIGELGLERSVLVAGLQADIPVWMQAMDVVVHASDREPFGIVILEAMALGKPVIAGTGGPEEILTDGFEGLITPYGDADALAGAVLRYLDDPDFAAAVGAAARRRATDFGVRTYASNVARVAREMTGQSS